MQEVTVDPAVPGCFPLSPPPPDNQFIKYLSADYVIMQEKRSTNERFSF